MTNAELADKVEEWLHGRELQYATIKLMADVIYALRRSQPEGGMQKAVEWVLRDAAYKAPEQIGSVPQRWIDCLRSAAEAEGRKP